jgi:hypothetical protein
VKSFDQAGPVTRKNNAASSLFRRPVPIDIRDGDLSESGLANALADPKTIQVNVGINSP